jgi:uncharacterized protein (UPF0303 family)
MRGDIHKQSHIARVHLSSKKMQLMLEKGNKMLSQKRFILNKSLRLFGKSEIFIIVVTILLHKISSIVSHEIDKQILKR